MRKIFLSTVFWVFISVSGIAASAFAHCDTMDGPVIKDAQTALETGNATAVRKWVKKEREAEVLQAFEEASAERKSNPDLKDKTDMRFFETLVRIHREGEGEHFDGIKPSGTPIEPGVAAADEALQIGSVDQLIQEITDNASEKIRERFNRAVETRKHMDESVEAGREYIEAYVEFLHYVEALDKSISGVVGHHHEP